MHFLLALVGALLVSTLATAQTVYRCTDARGQASFQQAPCDGHGTGAITVRPSSAGVEGQPSGDANVRREAMRSATARAAIARGEIVDGMTLVDVRQVLGEPLTVNIDVVNGRRQEQHVYRYADGSSRYVYFREGVVSGVQQRPGYGRREQGQPCPTQLEIRNAEVSARSVTISPDERRAKQARVDEMRRCVR